MKLVKSILALMVMGTICTGAYAADAVKITDLSKGAKVRAIKVGSTRTTDRFKLLSLSKELAGLQCVSVTRGNYAAPGKAYSFKVNVPVTVYLMVDGRDKKFKADGWEKTKLTATWSAGHAFKDTIYKKDFPAGKITIAANVAKIIPSTAIIMAKK